MFGVKKQKEMEQKAERMTEELKALFNIMFWSRCAGL